MPKHYKPPLSADIVKKLPQHPEGKPKIEYCCSRVKNLFLEVRRTSPHEGTYYLRFKNSHGTTAAKKLGTTSTMSLQQARAKAAKLKVEIAAGADPQADAKQRKAVPTLREFWENDYLPHAKATKRSWKDDVSLWELRIKAVFGDTRINAITLKAVQSFHHSVRDEGLAPASADHHLRLLKRMMTLATQWQYTDRSPIAAAKLFNADNQVEHYLNEEQLQRLLRVVQEHENRPVAAVVLWLLATGCRLGEALSATWADIDQEKRLWTVSAEHSKNRRRNTKVLNSVAMGILDKLEKHPEHDALFVGRRGPLTSIYKIWYQIRDSAGLPWLRLHDLRHAHASMLINEGAAIHDVQRALSHHSSASTLRYLHLSDARRRATADTAAACIQRAMPD